VRSERRMAYRLYAHLQVEQAGHMPEPSSQVNGHLGSRHLLNSPRLHPDFYFDLLLITHFR